MRLILELSLRAFGLRGPRHGGKSSGKRRQNDEPLERLAPSESMRRMLHMQFLLFESLHVAAGSPSPLLRPRGVSYPQSSDPDGDCGTRCSRLTSRPPALALDFMTAGSPPTRSQVDGSRRFPYEALSGRPSADRLTTSQLLAIILKKVRMIAEPMPDTRRLKDTLYEYFALIGKATSSPKRLEILDLLCQGEKNVDEIARQAQLDVKNASAHLKVLHSARLVATRREGKRVYYAIADGMVSEYWLTTRSMAEYRFAEIERVVKCYFNDRETMVTLDRQRLLGRARRGEVIVLDVRPKSEYEQAHLPHARSVPIAELEQRLATLPRNKQIIAYCRGPYCVLSVEALNVLRRRGFNALRLSDGILEWQAAGLPLAHGLPSEK